MRNRRRRRRDGLFHVFVVEVCEKSCDQLKSLPRKRYNSIHSWQIRRSAEPRSRSPRDPYIDLYIGDRRTFFPSKRNEKIFYKRSI